MTHKRLLVVTLTALLLTLLAACAANPKPTTLPTGAYNQTDAYLYDAMVTARGAIDGACQPGTSVAHKDNGLQPCQIKPELVQYKPQLNQAIASWNIAAAAQTTYRNALKNGGTPDSAAVMAAVNQVTTNTAALVTRISGVR